jgi:hypothetical protein
MTTITTFPKGVPEAIGNYVYRLIDPRNGETFYIGKGKGDRVFAHVNAASFLFDDEQEDSVSLKISRIQDISNAGLEVIHIIHRHDIPDEAIFEVEAALIDVFAGLSNIQGGHGSNAKGPMSIVEIVEKYALPTFDEEPEEKLVLININNIADRSKKEAIYEQTRLAWRISKHKAEAADYVLAVIRGVIVGIFVADKWLDATHDNFPDQVSLSHEMPERKGFFGSPASSDVWERFVGSRGKRITNDGMKHIQNPIRYWNI